MSNKRTPCLKGTVHSILIHKYKINGENVDEIKIKTRRKNSSIYQDKTDSPASDNFKIEESRIQFNKRNETHNMVVFPQQSCISNDYLESETVNVVSVGKYKHSLIKKQSECVTSKITEVAAGVSHQTIEKNQFEILETNLRRSQRISERNLKEVEVKGMSVQKLGLSESSRNYISSNNSKKTRKSFRDTSYDCSKKYDSQIKSKAASVNSTREMNQDKPLKSDGNFALENETIDEDINKRKQPVGKSSDKLGAKSNAKRLKKDESHINNSCVGQGINKDVMENETYIENSFDIDICKQQKCMKKFNDGYNFAIADAFLMMGFPMERENDEEEIVLDTNFHRITIRKPLIKTAAKISERIKERERNEKLL